MKSQSVLSWFDSNGFDAFEAHFNLNAFKIRIFAKIIGKNFINLMELVGIRRNLYVLFILYSLIVK